MTMAFESSRVFDNLPKDYLSLFHGQKPHYDAVVKALKFQKKDVSKATGIPLSSIRYDQRIPRKVADRIKEWAVLLNLVAQHFNGDGNKTILWFTLPNPLLGNISPRDMIRFGRYKKLYKFVINAIEENKR